MTGIKPADAQGELYQGIYLLRRWCARHRVGLDGARFVVVLPTLDERYRALNAIKRDFDMRYVAIDPLQVETKIRIMGLNIDFVARGPDPQP